MNFKFIIKKVLGERKIKFLKKFFYYTQTSSNRHFDKYIQEFRYNKALGNYTEALINIKKAKKIKTTELIEREIKILEDKINFLKTFNSKQIIKSKFDRNIQEKKVLHVLNTSMPYLSNGYSTRSNYILESQKECGIIPLALTRPGFPNDFKNKSLNFSGEYFKENYKGIDYYRTLPNLFMRLTTFSEYIEKYANVIVEVARKEKISTIQGTSNYVNGYAALMAARKIGVPFIYEVRGFWELTSVSKNKKFKGSEEFRLAQEVETFICQNADKVVVISEGLKNELIRRGIDKKKITIIPNGVNLEKFKVKEINKKFKNLYKKDGVFIIGYIGSVVKYEGLDRIIKSLKCLKSQGVRDIRFIIAGDGSYKEELELLSVQFDLKNEVKFLGKISHDEVSDLYSIFDLCIFPRIDSDVTRMVTPLKPLEAMAQEKIVLASNLNAMREIVKEGINGLIFSNDEELSNMIREIKESKKNYESLSKNSRRWVSENRNWKIISKQYLEVYKFDDLEENL